MKIAITTAENNLDAPVELRFGRATAFLIYDTETKATEIIDNKQNLNAAQGAGIQAAQFVINSGAEVLISGHCGPKAYKVLSKGNVKIYAVEAQTVASAIQKLEQGELAGLAGADVEEHWV